MQPREGRYVDYARDLSEEKIESRTYRRFVGGKWDQVGRLQLRFLVRRGLRPEHRLLDVGCGALRAGTRFAEYLAPGHYYGVDANRSLVDAGYERELSPGVRDTLPRENLRVTERFDCDFGVSFDYAIAQSVFTHVSLNQIRLCLYRVAQVMEPGGRFFATFFEAPEDWPLDEGRPGRVGKWTERNPFFYYRQDLRWAAGFGPWEFRYIGPWKHPRGQYMVEFRRIEDTRRARWGVRAREVGRRVPGAVALSRAVRR